MTLTESDAPRLKTVGLIYLREMRDQLRDRRTIFTIVILPILLYPLVGSLLLQIAQFTQQHAPRICVIGAENLPARPALVEHAELTQRYRDAAQNIRFTWLHWEQLEDGGDDLDVAGLAERYVDSGQYDAVLLVPPDFQLHRHPDQAGQPLSRLRILTKAGADGALVAENKLHSLLGRWRDDVVADALAAQGIESKVLKPFTIETSSSHSDPGTAMLWSKLLPFVMLIWAMTGAFYPAIDLVAGEKERGTLETLLCSPALRSEIVWGKLGAVTSFSMLTALLNVASMLITSSFIFQQLNFAGGGFERPSTTALLWLLLALFPLSALFSALALAVAALARSSKEGQYYLMPLMMVTLPLVLLPMMPGMTLNLGTALIPVSGMFLLARSLVEAQYLQAVLHLPLVLGVTFCCLWLATRWAQRQFEDEAVLFGDSDQWDMRSWVRHLWRDRHPVPSVAQAYACGALVLVFLFFGKMMISGLPQDTQGFAKLILLPQVGLILAPAVLMAIVLTTSLRETFRVRVPALPSLPVAVLLGISLHPLYLSLGQWITRLYPIGEQTKAALMPFTTMLEAAPLTHLIVLLALVPAICEELVFRGFIFSGLVRGGNQLRAIIVTAVFFGVSHGMLQQSISATVMGLLLGWIALRTGSVLPCFLVHCTNNALSVSLSRIQDLGSWGTQYVFITTEDGVPGYHPLWIVMSAGVATGCLFYFYTLRCNADQEASAADWPDPHPLHARRLVSDPGLKPIA